MSLHLEPALPEHATELAALHNSVAFDLTARFGPGHWSNASTERGVLSDLRRNKVYVAHRRGELVATLRLVTKKPWAIDKSYFTPCSKPLYLTSMAVAPHMQRQGIGRASVAEALRIAREWPADAIRLDAYDAPAGAGGFYAKCGFHEVGRVVYRGTPLVYFESVL